MSFERRYQGAEGVWRNSPSFKLDGLLLLAKAADKAHDGVLYILREERS